ncbi:MAG: hypothetical protein MAG794_01024 [Gammaproteobacteria bacterium]|nr:hypothetical protein [Gammaproteobacteria bacterium]
MKILKSSIHAGCCALVAALLSGHAPFGARNSAANGRLGAKVWRPLSAIRTCIGEN